MRSHYIIDSSATLLGVSLLIVTAVHVTGKQAESIADELSFAAALLFLGGCAASHAAIAKSNDRFERYADMIFAVALVVLLCSVLSFWL
jgi:cytochrome bd-type quinol oxidase subunit 2